MNAKPFSTVLLVVVTATLTTQLLPAPAQAQRGTLDWTRFFRLVYADDGNGNSIPTVRISGANLQVVNGMDDTETANGTGNLVVGYNEFRSAGGDDRSGSHNIAFGKSNNFTSFGGMVGPEFNSISAPFATVTGGLSNEATAPHSSVTGGAGNDATGDRSSVSGGRGNEASGRYSSVSAGHNGIASGELAAISGGVVGRASGHASSVSGGDFNVASGRSSSVSGGNENVASNYFSSVTGGSYNSASGWASSVSGGDSVHATGQSDWRAGSLFEDQ